METQVRSFDGTRYQWIDSIKSSGLKTVQAGLGEDIEFSQHPAPKSIHVNSTNGAISWDVSGSTDGDYYYVINTGSEDAELPITGDRLAAVFARNGSPNDIIPTRIISVKAGEAWIILLTDNNGNKFVNALKMGGSVAPIELPDALHFYHGKFENQDGVNGYRWTDIESEGTAIAKDPNSIEFRLEPGFVYEVQYAATQGRSNAQFISVEFLIDGVRGDTFFPVSGDDGNWEGGNGFIRTITVGETDPASIIQFKRVSSSGNGNHDANLLIKAIGKGSKTKLAEIIPARAITSNGTALSPAKRGYDGQVSIIEVPIATEGMSLSLEQASIDAGHFVVYPGHGSDRPALVAVTPNGSDVDIAWTEAENLSTFTGLQTVGTYRPIASLTLNSNSWTAINTGFDLRNKKWLAINFGWGSTTALAATRSFSHFCDLADSNDGFFNWNYSAVDGHCEIRIDDKATGVISFRRVGSDITVKSMDLYADAANGYVIPAATELASPVALTINVDGAIATVSSPSNENPFNITSGIVNQIQVELPSDRMIGALYSLTADVTVAAVDLRQGVISVAAPVLTSNATIEIETAPINQYEVLLLERAFVGEPNGQNADIDNGMTVGDWIDTYDFIRVEVFQGNANRWLQSFLLSTKAIADSEQFVLIASSYGTEYITLRPADTTDWQTQRTQTQLKVSSAGMGTGSKVLILGINGNTALPLGYNAPELKTLTVAGATLKDGNSSIPFLEGLPFEVAIALTADEILDTATVDSGTASIKDVSLGLVSILASADATLTISKVERPELAKLEFSGNIIDSAYNAHTRILPGAIESASANEGNGIEYDGNGIFTVTRDMTINAGVFLKNSEGAGLGHWLRVSMAMGGYHYRSLGFPDGNYNNPSSGINEWFSEFTGRVAAGTKIQFQNRVSANYPGKRNGKVWIKELA